MTTDSAKKAAAYVKRMENLMRQVTELQADIKDICTEAKAAGFSAPLLRRWASAMAKDKAGALALQTMELHTIGETLVPDLFGVKAPEEKVSASASAGRGGSRPHNSRTTGATAAPVQLPNHDADGVIIESPDADPRGERAKPSTHSEDDAAASGHGIDGESSQSAADAEAAGMSRLAPAPRPAVGMSAPAASISAGEIDTGIPAFLDKRRRL